MYWKERWSSHPIWKGDHPVTKNECTSLPQISFQLDEKTSSLLEYAASIKEMSLHDFILYAARQVAEDTELDQTLITVSPEEYERFVERLNAPPEPNERLRQMMRRPAPWETKS